jgi:hypothetical protein
MLGAKVVVVMCDTRDEVAELYLDRRGLLVARALIPGGEWIAAGLIEEVVTRTGIPEMDTRYGYDYQLGPEGYLEEVSDVVDDLTFNDVPVRSCIMKISWCPYVPESGNGTSFNRDKRAASPAGNVTGGGSESE